ncbi:hypothetical protein PINS_up006851 [Pythium insidiosum]|nr:hypothetical protein PINS_up006851 [Pythium insidiosum]
MLTPQLAFKLDMGFLDPALFESDAMDTSEALAMKPLAESIPELSFVSSLESRESIGDFPVDNADLLDDEFWASVIAMEQQSVPVADTVTTPVNRVSTQRSTAREALSPPTNKRTTATSTRRVQRKIASSQAAPRTRNIQTSRRTRNRTSEQREREKKQKKLKDARCLQRREELLLTVRHLRRILLCQIALRYTRGHPVAGQGHGVLEPALLAFHWHTTTQLLHHMQAFTSQNRNTFRERVVETIEKTSVSGLLGV